MASRDKKLPDKRNDSVGSELMHRFKTHPILFIGSVLILVFITIAFVFPWGPGGQSGNEFVFGYYNKVPIKYALNSYFYQVQQNISRSQSGQDDNIFMTYSIWKYAFDEAVIQAGILDEMKQAGYSAPEGIVDRAVAMQFQENGAFAAARYRALDSNTRMSIWRQAQDSLATGYYINDFSTLRVASKEASFISSMASPQRSFEAAIFPFSLYPDSEMAAFAQANPSLFRIAHLSRITVSSSEREAQLILESVRNGVSTFEEAAITNSQDEFGDRGGDMGTRMAYELMYEIADEQIRESIINLPRGSLSEVIRTPSGAWVFYRAEEAARPSDPNDPVQMEKIRSYIMGNLRGRAEDWLTAEAERFSARVREIGFDAAAYEGNITTGSFGPLPMNYGNSTLFSAVSSSGISELANAGVNQFFWRAAFSTPVYTPSTPLVIGDNVIVLFPLEEIEADENERQMIESYYPYWLGGDSYWTANALPEVYRDYFLYNEKLDDRFEDTFWKIMGY